MNCPCGCGQPLTGRQKSATSACRQRLSRAKTVTTVTKCDTHDRSEMASIMTVPEFEQKVKEGWNLSSCVEVANCYIALAHGPAGQIEPWYISKHGWPKEEAETSDAPAL